MFTWTVLQGCFVLLIMIVIGTQVVLPPFIGKSFFWIFKKGERRYRCETDVNYDLEVEDEAIEIGVENRRMKKNIERKRKKL